METTILISIVIISMAYVIANIQQLSKKIHVNRINESEIVERLEKRVDKIYSILDENKIETPAIESNSIVELDQYDHQKYAKYSNYVKPTYMCVRDYTIYSNTQNVFPDLVLNLTTVSLPRIYCSSGVPSGSFVFHNKRYYVKFINLDGDTLDKHYPIKLLVYELP